VFVVMCLVGGRGLIVVVVDVVEFRVVLALTGRMVRNVLLREAGSADRGRETVGVFLETSWEGSLVVVVAVSLNSTLPRLGDLPGDSFRALLRVFDALISTLRGELAVLTIVRRGLRVGEPIAILRVLRQRSE